MDKLDKFLELSFLNYTNDRSSDEFTGKVDALFEPIIEKIHSLLNKEIADDIEDSIMMAYLSTSTLAGVEGMKVAIGVMNGSIKQNI